MCTNFQQLVSAISKALGARSMSMASGAFTLDPKALMAPWPIWCHAGLRRRRFAAFLDSRRRRRLRRLRFAGFLQRRRRWRCRLCNLEQVWRHGLGCRKLRGFPRRIRFWREGLCRRTHAVRRWRRHVNHGFAARFGPMQYALLEPERLTMQYAVQLS